MRLAIKCDVLSKRLTQKDEEMIKIMHRMRALISAGNEMERLINIPKIAHPSEWASDLEIDNAIDEWKKHKHKSGGMIGDDLLKK